MTAPRANMYKYPISSTDGLYADATEVTAPADVIGNTHLSSRTTRHHFRRHIWPFRLFWCWFYLISLSSPYICFQTWSLQCMCAVVLLHRRIYIGSICASISYRRIINFWKVNIWWNYIRVHCLSLVILFWTIFWQTPSNHLLSAIFLSAPAVFSVTKLSWPETKKSCTKSQKDVELQSRSK